jgi:methyltransferase (TIGR00027 family)
MARPDLFHSLYVARLRYIQSIHESSERRNPDTLVRRLLPLIRRWRDAWLGTEDLAMLRADPFYYYLVARTRYYDKVFNDAISVGVQRIFSIGCGSDTRPYRFEAMLRSSGVQVLECDLQNAIQAKRRIVRRWPGAERVEYLSLDLNEEAWPDLSRRLGDEAGADTLVIMEGVSPYVNESNFHRFLSLLGSKLRAGSQLAYDFKLRGVKEGFGRVGRTQRPFRLPADRDELEALHLKHRLRLTGFERSSELCARLLPDAARPAASRFAEDALVRLEVVST